MIWIAIGSLAVSLATLVWSRIDVRRARDAAADADERAERATRAAEQSAEAQQAMAEHLPKPEVRWEVRNLRGMLYELRNVGERPAHSVDLSFTHEEVIERMPESLPSPWPPNVPATFRAAGSGQSGTPELRITWRDEPGGELRSLIETLAG